ncbi:4-hydroxy-tetrahydrodipicolinate synthase [Eubacteriales bacterium OttesenSCG-928-G02]|nr:4-hydroxy-tetrahydrodipicolinate synthase [Eubacteriales bacterium OttesenSCG-928-G02]
MKNTIFKGTGTAIITPFKNNEIDYDAYEALIEMQIANGINAIVTCGTTGEASTLSDNEHRSMIKFTVSKVNGRVPVIAGAGSNDLAYAIDLSQFSCEAGVDALLHITPYYNKTSQRGLVKYYEAIADASTKPIIMYNLPGRTGMKISIDAYKELEQHQNIVATKEASGDLNAIMDLMAECKNLDVYSGNDNQIVPMMSVGAIGVISVISNLLPKETVEITKLFLEDKVKESAQLQLKLLKLINALFMPSSVNPIPIKTAMAKVGLCKVDMRMPLYEMSTSESELLYSIMKEYGVI